MIGNNDSVEVLPRNLLFFKLKIWPQTGWEYVEQQSDS